MNKMKIRFYHNLKPYLLPKVITNALRTSYPIKTYFDTETMAPGYLQGRARVRAPAARQLPHCKAAGRRKGRPAVGAGARARRAARCPRGAVRGRGPAAAAAAAAGGTVPVGKPRDEVPLTRALVGMTVSLPFRLVHGIIYRCMARRPPVPRAAARCIPLRVSSHE